MNEKIQIDLNKATEKALKYAQDNGYDNAELVKHDDLSATFYPTTTKQSKEIKYTGLPEYIYVTYEYEVFFTRTIV